MGGIRQRSQKRPHFLKPIYAPIFIFSHFEVMILTVKKLQFRTKFLHTCQHIWLSNSYIAETRNLFSQTSHKLRCNIRTVEESTSSGNKLVIRYNIPQRRKFISFRNHKFKFNFHRRSGVKILHISCFKKPKDKRRRFEAASRVASPKETLTTRTIAVRGMPARLSEAMQREENNKKNKSPGKLTILLLHTS